MTYKKLQHVDVFIISDVWVDNLNSKAEPSLQIKHRVKVQTIFLINYICTNMCLHVDSKTMYLYSSKSVAEIV